MVTHLIAHLHSKLQALLKEHAVQLLSVMALSLLPLCAVAGHWIYTFQSIFDLQEQIESLALRAPRASYVLQEWEQYKERYSNAAPFFIEETVGKHIPLQKERAKLTAFLQLEMFTNQAELKRRSEAITSEKNRFRFREKVLFENNQWKESLLSQLSSVELDENDAATVLSLLEGKQIGAPQILVTDCHLFTDGKTLRMKTELLKREVKE